MGDPDSRICRMHKPAYYGVRGGIISFIRIPASAKAILAAEIAAHLVPASVVGNSTKISTTNGIKKSQMVNQGDV